MTNLFELFELLDRYQSEMIDFFVLLEKIIELGDMDYWWDKDDKYKEIADNLFINEIINEKEYTNVINKKEKIRDDYER